MGTAAAFFDLDRTLIRGSATFALGVAAFRKGLRTPLQMVDDIISAIMFTRHGVSDERSEQLRESVLASVTGHYQRDVAALGEAFVPRLASRILPESRLLLDLHEGRGEDRIIVSASPIEIVTMLAERLGLQGAVGTRAEVDAEGRYTGRLDGEFCYGAGKVTEVRRLAAERGYDLDACTAYSDSISDVAFLECVGTAVAVNPDRELRELAMERRWRIVEVKPGGLRFVRRHLLRTPRVVRRDQGAQDEGSQTQQDRQQ